MHFRDLAPSAVNVTCLLRSVIKLGKLGCLDEEGVRADEQAFVPVTALSPSAVFASTIENAPATKIILTAQFVAAKHIDDETLCFQNCH